MKAVPLSQIAAWCGAKVPSGLDQLATSVSTDTRSIKPGAVFVALRGDNFNGHAFAAKALVDGAIAVVADHFPKDLPASAPVLVVPDTLIALQQMAGKYRRTLPIPIVGITGSSGKTTTKDFTAAVLGTRLRVLKTAGNLNNHIGVPLTLLQINDEEVAVVEMGMNHAGEIAPLAAMAAPKVGIITNVGVAHIEHFKNQEAIAEEKGRLAEAIPEEGTVLMDGGDLYAEFIRKRTRAKFIATGRDENLRAEAIEITAEGTRFNVIFDGKSHAAFVPLPGAHMVRNALLALGAGMELGVSLEEGILGLANVPMTGGRAERRELDGIHILDDTYNANPDSVCAALETVARMPSAGRRIAVLGKMHELGVESERGHTRVGESAGRANLDIIVTVGPEAALIGRAAIRNGAREVFYAKDTSEAAKALFFEASVGDLILVKGSRGARMERVIDDFAALKQKEKGAAA